MKKIFILFLLLLCPFNVFAYEVDVNSKNVFMYNLDTNEVVYDKNSDEKVLIASLTKIMTTIVSLENIEDLDEKVVVTNEILSYITDDLSIAGFEENEEVTYRDLLYGSLLPSGADATHSLAYYIAGSEEKFIELMNEKAKELGMNDTHFENSIGIEPENNNHFSTAKDMYKLLSYCIENEEFLKIFMTDEYETSNKLHKFTSSKYKASKKNDVDLSIIKGSKTGFTSKAHLCLASISDKNNTNLLLITIGSDEHIDRIGHFNDSKKLYEYYTNNYSNKDILKSGKKIIKLKTVYDEEVNIYQDNNVVKYLKNDSDIKYLYKGKKELEVGTKKGDKIGVYTVIVNDKVIYKENIYSPIDVNYKIPFTSIILVIIFFSLLLYLFKILKKQKRS